MNESQLICQINIMSGLAKKRTIDAFFKPPSKKPRVEGTQDAVQDPGGSSEPVEEQVSR
jgi:hypothetical protein